MKQFGFFAAFLFGMLGADAQELMHYWHFNNLPSSGDFKTAEADFSLFPDRNIHITYTDSSNRDMDDYGNGSDLNLQLGEQAGNALRVRNRSEGRSLLIDLPSDGFEDLSVAYAVYRSGSGMLTQLISYTTNGSDYVFFDSVSVTENYQLQTLDFSGILEVNDNPDFKIRITFRGNTTLLNGNNRFDNLSMHGTPQGFEPVTSVNLDTQLLALSPQDSFLLLARISPPNASNTELRWETRDENVATVNQQGLVRAVDNGSTFILSITEDGGFVDSCKIVVIDSQEVEFTISSEGTPAQDALVSVHGNQFSITAMVDSLGQANFALPLGNYQYDVTGANYLDVLNEPFEVGAEPLAIEVGLTPFEQDLIYYWHFNNLDADADEIVSPIQVDEHLIFRTPNVIYEGVGAGYLDAYSPGSNLNLQMDEPAGLALRVRNPSIDRALVIELPSDQSEDLLLMYDVHRSGSGMLFQDISYSIDGENFIKDGLSDILYEISTDYQTIVIDFSEIAEVNDNRDFKVRIEFEGNIDQNNGNNRFDNITLFGKVEEGFVNRKKDEQWKFQVFPNPAQSELTLDLSGVKMGNSNMRVNIWNMQGKLQKTFVANSGQNSWSVENWKTGIYVIQLIDPETGKNAVQKVVVK